MFPEILLDLDLTNSKGAWFFAVASFMALPGGYLITHKLSNHWSEKFCFLISLFTLSLGMILIGLSYSFWMLILSVTILGLSFGGLGVMQNLLVIKSSHPDMIAQSQSALHTMYGASSFLAPLLVNLIHMWSDKWQSVFLFCGLTTLLFSIYYLNKNLKTSDKSIQYVKQRTNIKHIYFSIFLGLYVVAELVIGTRLSLFLRQEYKMTLEQTSNSTALFFAGLLLGRFLFIFFKPKANLRLQILFFLLISLACLLLGVYVNYYFLVFCGLSMAPIYPLAMSLSGVYFKDSLPQVMSAIVAYTAFAVVSMHLSFGVITDYLGIQKAMLIGCFGLTSSCLILLSFNKINYFQKFH